MPTSLPDQKECAKPKFLGRVPERFCAPAIIVCAPRRLTGEGEKGSSPPILRQYLTRWRRFLRRLVVAEARDSTRQAVLAADRLLLTIEEAASATDFAAFSIEKMASAPEVVAFSTAIVGSATKDSGFAMEFATIAMEFMGRAIEFAALSIEFAAFAIEFRGLLNGVHRDLY